MEFAYNKASQRTAAAFDNAAASAWTYDATGMLEKIEHSNPQATPVASFEYDYNLDGLRTKVTREDDSYIEYTYDDLNRLSKEEAKNSGGTMQWKREYTYDAAGNRTEIDKDDGSGTTTYTYSYNNLKQLSTVQWSSYQKAYTYDDNGNLATMNEQHNIGMGYVTDIAWTYTWDVQDRLTAVAKDDQTVSDDDLLIEYEYCATCGGALSERVEYDGYVGGNVVSWLRYEYEGLNLLRIDERYDDDDPANGIDSGDPWRPLNVFVHAPGSIGQIVRAKWYNYRDCTTTPCDSGYYYYFYDTLGNVAGVYDENTDQFIDYEMDAFGNGLPGGNAFLAMDQPGPKEHLTGKMFDTDTGLYYFHARWYDPEVGRFVSRDPASFGRHYIFGENSPLIFVDPLGLYVYMIFYGDPGLGRHNVGSQFQLSAETLKREIKKRADFDQKRDKIVLRHAKTKSDFFSPIHQHKCIKEIHVFSHSARNAVFLGEDPGKHYNLYAADFERHHTYGNWDDRFASGAFIKFWGCNTGFNKGPQSFLQRIADSWRIDACGSPTSTHFDPQGPEDWGMTPDRGKDYYCVSPK